MRNGGVISHIHNLVLMEVSGQLHAPWNEHHVDGWVGLRADLDFVKNSLFPFPGIKPRFLSRPALTIDDMPTDLSQIVISMDC
jgi:hypothetical protein